MSFYCFYGFNWDFLQFPSVNSSKIFTTHRFQRDTNFKHEKSSGCKGSFLDFFFSNLCRPFTTAKTVVLQASLKKRVLTKIKYLLPDCQILHNFTEGNARKSIVSFAFSGHVDGINIEKHRLLLLADYLSFHPQPADDR